MEKIKDQDAAELNQVINRLAMNILSVEAEDIMAFGNILTQIEEIEKIAEAPALKNIHHFCSPLKKLIEKIIFNECSSPQQSLDLISSGIQIIQAKISRGDLNQNLPEEGPFWEQVESLMGPLKPVPFDSQGGEPSPEQSPRGNSLEISQDMELFNDFVTEALEHLESIEINLINLEQDPEDKESLNAIFRLFHTIKGVAGFLNLAEIQKFAHAVESLLDEARNDKVIVNQKIIDTILEAVDFLKTMIFDQKVFLVSGKPQPKRVDRGSLLDRIGLLRENQPPVESSIETPEIKVPTLGEILVSKGIVSVEEVERAQKAQVEGKYDQKIGEILIAGGKVKPKEVLEGLREQKLISGQEAQATVRVDTNKLDNMVDMVGELVIAQSLVQQNPNLTSIIDQKLIRDFAQLKRITLGLQKIAMSLRLVPIRYTFQKMIRVVRDLSKKSDKQVDLKLYGEETEIDRNMVETLYDPLVHMIRNSMDHGIEPPQIRKETGKPEIGEISLRAYQKGGNIVIEIEDDGQGLNREKILAKAKERKIISGENSLTDFQIDNLIFEPGFSTAEKITDVSGRGVGMDVVKRMIEKIRGKTEIYSVNGKGCRFVIRVPLTMAIMDGILVKIGQERFIIPTVTIKETLRPAREDVFTVGRKETMVRVRNSLLPLIRLNNLLNIQSNDQEPWQGLVVVVENDGIQKGLMVDDLLGKQEVVIKNLGEKLKTVRGVAGGAILGDGRISLILDVNDIFEIYSGKTTKNE